MNDMTFALRLTATDDTQSALRSMLSGFTSAARTIAKPITVSLRIAQGAMGFLRDFNLGLRPLLSGLDDVIDKGTAMGAVGKSLGHMLGGSEVRADRLGQRLIDAAHGSITLDEAMKSATMAIAAGLDASRDLPVIFDFASKKAASMGVATESLLSGMFTGLARGTTRTFEPLGILQKGIEGVKRDYEAIAGAKAWDALTPAAQQAEMIRQATAEMRQQMDRLGLSGKETVFVWRGIKNSITDSVDRLVEAVARSESLRTVLKGVSNVFSGATQWLNKGGSLGDLVWGKRNDKGEQIGQSQGLWGGFKAIISDLGELIGRGILGGILKGFSALPDLFNGIWTGLKAAWTWAVSEIPPAIQRGLSWLKTDFLPALRDLFTGFVEDIRGLLGKPANKVEEAVIPKKISEKWQGMEGTAIDQGRGDPIARILLGATQWLGEAYLKHVVDPIFGRGGSTQATKPVESSAQPSLAAGVEALKRYFESKTSSLIYPPAFVGGQWLKYVFQPLLDLLGTKRSADIPVGVGLGFGIGLNRPAMATSKSMFQRAGDWGDQLLSGGVLGGDTRTGDWLGKFRGDFPTSEDEAKKARARARSRAATTNIEQTIPWNLWQRQKRAAELRKLDREIAHLDPGGDDTWLRREAYQETEQELRRLRKAGRMTPVGTRERVRAEIEDRLRDHRDEQRKELMKKRDSLAQELGQGREPAKKNEPSDEGSKALVDASGNIQSSVEQMKNMVNAMVEAIAGGVKAITGADAALAGVGAGH